MRTFIRFGVLYGAVADLGGWATDVVVTGAFTDRPDLVMKEGLVVTSG
jgi:hypothetical protein